MYNEDKMLIIDRYGKIKDDLIDVIGDKVFKSIEASVNPYNNKIIFEDINSLKSIINRAVDRAVSKVLTSCKIIII